MTDNLNCLIRHCEPESVLKLLKHQSEVTLPVMDPLPGKRKHRVQLIEQCQTLPQFVQVELDKAAGKILCLTDNAGKDAVMYACEDLLDDVSRTRLWQCANQYERSLWLYIDQPLVFRDALDRHALMVLRRSTRTCKGFRIGKGHVPCPEERVDTAIIEALADRLKCPVDQIAVVIHERGETDTGEPESYDIRCYYNRAPESREQVRSRKLVKTDVVWAESIYFSYQPDNGGLEVMSYHLDDWEGMARLVSEELLGAVFSGQAIPVREFDIKRLAQETFEPDLSVSTSLLRSKVTSIDWRHDRKALSVTSSLNESGSVYDAARTLGGQGFTPSSDDVHKAVLTLKVRADEPGERARSIIIAITGHDRCSIKSTRKKDEALAMLALNQWGIARTVGDEVLSTG